MTVSHGQLAVTLGNVATLNMIQGSGFIILVNVSQLLYPGLVLIQCAKILVGELFVEV